MTGGERWITVGRVGRPHGLAGCFVVENPSEDPGRFRVGARMYAGREPVVVTESKRAGGRLVVGLDRPVERGAALELPVSELPPPGEGEFYAFQLEGLAVVDDTGRSLGRVRAAEPGVANDVLALDSGLLLPLVEDCVLEVDLEEGRVVVARSYAEPE